MKNSKRLFLLIEAAWAIMVIVLAFVMFMEKNEKKMDKISVIVQNSDDEQWSAFKYGLRMAAQDHQMEVFVVNTGGSMTVEEQKSLIQQEISSGADGIIAEPVQGDGVQEMLKKFEKKVPVMLVQSAAGRQGQESSLPITQPDNYEMGKTLAKELLKDYNGSLDGKTLGIFMETMDLEASVNRKKGFEEVVTDTGGDIRWVLAGQSGHSDENSLEVQPTVDFVIALDDHSLTAAGKCAAAKNLHGALVYGIGNSTEAVYYLDTGIVQCLVVPDDFNVGYQSLSQTAESLEHFFYKMQDRTVTYTVIRADTLFSKENQEILFTMTQ